MVIKGTYYSLEARLEVSPEEPTAEVAAEIEKHWTALFQITLLGGVRKHPGRISKRRARLNERLEEPPPLGKPTSKGQCRH